MKPTLEHNAHTCREFLGTKRGWCPNPATEDWLDASFCDWHAAMRRKYDEDTRRRTGALR